MDILMEMMTEKYCEVYEDDLWTKMHDIGADF